MPPRTKVQYVDEPAAVGRRLRAAREAAGLSQRQLSFPGCTSAYISRIENGERTPSLQLLREFARRVGVSEAYLAFGRSAVDSVAARVVDGCVAARLGELDAARAAVAAAVAAASSDEERAQADAAGGAVALAAGDAQAAVALLERARRLDPSLEDDPDVADALGRAHAAAGALAAAEEVLGAALQRAREAGDTLEVVRFAGLLASVLADAGERARAERALADAPALADRLGDPQARARELWAQSRRVADSDPAAAARSAERALVILEVSEREGDATRVREVLARLAAAGD